MSTAYSDGFYDFIHREATESAAVIVPLALKLTGASSVVDVGCGQGAWLAEFKRNGVARILGLDGRHVRREALLVEPAEFMAVDLENPPATPGRFDLAVSLEVAEHIPAARAAAFADFLVSLAPVLLFSAAIPFQDGTHHVNEQWQAYWAGLFDQRGFQVVDAIRPEVWNDARVAPWYRQNTLVYAGEAALREHPALLRARKRTDERLLSLVHPDTFTRSNNRPMGSVPRLLGWLPKLAALKILRAASASMLTRRKSGW